VALVGKKESGKSGKGASKWVFVQRWLPNWAYELLTLYYNIYGYYALARAIRATRPGLIYERYSLNTFCGIWAGRRFSIPTVIEVNLPLYYEKSKFGALTFDRFTRFSERWICSHGTKTIVVSEAMKRLFVREGVPADKMVVMANGVDPTRFHPGVSGEEVRKKYGLQGAVVLGFVGWFREWHGLDRLVQIMYESRLGERGVKLLLVGDGPAYPDLQRYVETHHLLSSVVFSGAVARQDVPAYVAAMDVTVLPRTNDYGCPMKLIEYMAMRKCMVAPKLPVVEELIQDGSTGLLFESGDMQGLRDAILRVVDDKQLRDSLGEKAFEYLRDRGFYWKTNAERTLKLVMVDAGST
jgi:glycosyltransferase involved in cell wall biosynthesis